MKQNILAAGSNSEEYTPISCEYTANEEILQFLFIRFRNVGMWPLLFDSKDIE